MNGVYIATFYSHFGAISFKKLCDKQGFSSKVMPVPRNLSSSCGTCVRFEGAYSEKLQEVDELEQVAEVLTDGYKTVYMAENA